jgi:hypothetical protein
VLHMFNDYPEKNDFAFLTLISLLCTLPIIFFMFDSANSLRLMANRPPFKCCFGQISQVSPRRRRLR